MPPSPPHPSPIPTPITTPTATSHLLDSGGEPRLLLIATLSPYSTEEWLDGIPADTVSPPGSSSSSHRCPSTRRLLGHLGVTGKTWQTSTRLAERVNGRVGVATVVRVEIKCCTVSLSLTCWPQSLLRQHSWLQLLPFVSQYLGIQSLPYECLVFSVLFAGTFRIQSLPYECLVFSVLFASSFGFSLCYTSLVFSVLSASSFGFSLCHTNVLYSLSILLVPLDSVSVVRVSCILCLLCQYIWIQSLPYVYECPVFSFFFASSVGFSLCHTYTCVLYSLSTLPVPLDSVSAVRVVSYSLSSLPVPLDSVSVLFASAFARD